ncbi:hypothetical protein [Aeromonas salmonicida]|uniref:hypothetical protein n=1 Tax=Aeromonas salmonicida TaxID=645 RepID=UPI001142FC75|nr:hypothetical protein [Aeromonas salmonicida]
MAEMCWVEAIYHGGGVAYRDNKCVFFISVQSDKLCEGRWFGYFINDGVTLPFIMNRNCELFFGGEEHYRETTNLAKIKIQEKEYFTVTVPYGEHEGEHTYRITRVAKTPFMHHYAPHKMPQLP